jgi:hypothetical protein
MRTITADGKLVYNVKNGDWQPIREADLDTQLDLSAMNAWDVACVIGMTESLLTVGYADDFDAVDYEGFAADFKDDWEEMAEVTPRRLYEWYKAAE